MKISWSGSNVQDEAVSPLSAHIGQQINKVRQAKQWTLKQMAKHVGISTPFLCSMENGKRMPTAKTLLKLSRATGRPFGFWVQGFRVEDL